MMIKSMKKILASIVIAAYLIVYAAPMGMCISAVAQIDTGVQKPVLRGASQPSSLKLEGDISLTKGNPKISLSLRDSDVKQVLRMFADKAGLNVIFHDSVSGKVTMDLVNVPLNDAFKMVMQVTNLTYYVDHNTMIVASASAAQSLNLAKQELMTIPIKYVDAAVLADFLNKNIFSLNKPGLSNSNIAVTNPSTNEILIFGTKNDYLMAKKVVEQFDKKPLEETFVVNHTTPKEMSDLLCKTLFQSFTSSSSTSGSSSSSSSSSTGSSENTSSAAPAQPAPPTPSMPISNMPTGGAASMNTLAGVITGGAANAGGSSSGSGSGSSGSSSGSVSDLTLGTGIIACQYNNSVTTNNLSSLNTSNLTISYFPQRGTISAIGGSAQQLQLIRDFIAKNDKKQPQAYLELSIIELSESGSREFNNTWNIYSGFFNGSFNGTTSTNPLFPNFIQGDNATVYGSAKDNYPYLYQLGRYAGPRTITYTMNYLIQNGKGRVLANPKIMITNGQASIVDLSSDYVKTVKSEILGNAGGLAGGIQRTYEIGNDEGIKVSMIPFISPEGYVTLNIKPEYSTIKEKVTTPNPDNPDINDLQATLLQRRNLDLKNIRIKDGETLVIGGMIRENETKNVSKIPVLGDLPGVGMFFRNTSSTKEKQELVIMITPKIIKDTEDIVNKPGTTL